MSKRLTRADRLFGEKIKEQRIRYKKSRREVAEKIGISQQQIEKYENCQDRISTGRLADFAKALEVGFLEVVPDEFLQLYPIDVMGLRMWNKLKYGNKELAIRFMKEMIH